MPLYLPFPFYPFRFTFPPSSFLRYLSPLPFALPFPAPAQRAISVRLTPVQDEDDTDRFDRTLSMRRMPPRPQPEPVLDKRAADRRQGNARILIGTIIVIAVLHLARPVVVPVALAVLFAFLLTIRTIGLCKGGQPAALGLWSPTSHTFTHGVATMERGSDGVRPE